MTDEQDELSELQAHIRMIGDALAEDLDATEEQREQNRAIGRKFAHLPD